jgi:enediyne biosynthesis protein E4
MRLLRRTIPFCAGFSWLSLTIAVLSAPLLVFAALLSGEEAGRPGRPTFVNIADSAHVAFKCEPSKTSRKYLIETMVGGVAVFDYDGDSLLDIFFVNGAALQDPMPRGKVPDKSDPRYWNRLYHNNGDGTFTDVTEKAGLQGKFYGQGVAIGDYDNDGRPDIYVTNFGHNTLYHNNGDGTFTDVTEKAGVGASGWSAGAAFVDYDRDGRLDLFVTRYLAWDFEPDIWCGATGPGMRSYCHPENYQAVSSLLFHNNGDGTFTDVTEKSGLAKAPGKGLGVDINDYDHDGWPDIFVANDAIAEQLFHNNHDGTFTEVGIEAGTAYDENGSHFSGMGVSFDDYDNDGWPDVFVGDLANQMYALFHNQKGHFEYVTGLTGLARTTISHSGWGTKFFDYDNDGWKDLFVAQSHVMDNVELSLPALHYREPMLLLRNNHGRFEDVSGQSGEVFKLPLVARGAAFGDLDNDGFVDIAVHCLEGTSLVLRNQGGNGNHWLLINTVGTVSNRDGIGAVVRVVSESGVEQYAMVKTSGSYFSASDKRVHFGLGAEKIARLVEITWPSGIMQRLTNVRADQILTVKEPAKK